MNRRSGHRHRHRIPITRRLFGHIRECRHIRETHRRRHRLRQKDIFAHHRTQQRRRRTTPNAQANHGRQATERGRKNCHRNKILSTIRSRQSVRKRHRRTLSTSTKPFGAHNRPQKRQKTTRRIGRKTHGTKPLTNHKQ